MSKKPRWLGNPSTKKSPRREVSPENSEKEIIAWHLSIVDRDGPWGWQTASLESTHWNFILDKVKSFETMTWAAIHSNRSHLIKKNELCSDAQKRLIKIKQDDVDELYSLRLGGTERIWGIREGRIFKVLWWDPSHTVCPSNKKHT